MSIFTRRAQKTISSLNTRAYMLVAQGHYLAARALFERALIIYEQTLGPDHPGTISVRGELHNLSTASPRE